MATCSLVTPDSTLTLRVLSTSLDRASRSLAPSRSDRQEGGCSLRLLSLTGSCELPPRVVDKEAGRATSAHRLQGEPLGCQSTVDCLQSARQRDHNTVCHSTDPQDLQSSPFHKPAPVVVQGS